MIKDTDNPIPSPDPAVDKDTSPKGLIWDGLRLQLKIGGLTFLIAWVLLWLYGQFYRGEEGETGILTRLYEVAVDVEVALALIAFITSIFLVTGLAFSFSYTSELKRSVTHLIYQMKQVQRGSLKQRIQLNREDEMNRLASELNEMTDGYEKQIRSMHRILNENAILISEKERAAGLEERRKLARELHDAVSQQLFAVSMSLGAIPRMLDEEPERSKQLIEQIEKMIHDAQQELRALIMHLRPITLEGKALKEALDYLFQELQPKHPQMQFKWTLEELPLLDPGIEDQLFRVVQEGLSNTLRHSKAAVFSFGLKHKDQKLLVMMKDDGIGFNMDDQKDEQQVSYGLTTMRERIEELGGHFSMLSYPGEGTTIKIRVPIAGVEREGRDEVE
ncbi:sensor histidine kinase [Alteribacter populi]|uniref:sensor histidine kinase n=1 Tax=Alteribacter populi TaxID=2011011 RepID=UPI000BBAE02F|nr:sensor histidine kinase [Alteribacter populi]